MTPKRGYLTPRERLEIFERQGGVCVVPGCGSTGPFEDEHTIPSAIAGGKPDALMCLPCHRAKTKRDRPVIAKVKRLAGDTTTQAERRRQRKEAGRPPLLRGRGFPKKRRARTAEEIIGSAP
jgi:hypothetical protein